LQQNKEINVEIGFVTGCKSFLRVLKTNIYNWNESKLKKHSLKSFDSI